MFDSQNPINPPYKWWLNAWLTSPIYQGLLAGAEHCIERQHIWGYLWRSVTTELHGFFPTENDGFTRQNDGWTVRLKR